MRSGRFPWCILALLCGLQLHVSDHVAAQPPAVPPVLGGDQGMLKLRTQGEIPLSDFVDYIAQRLQLRILYDDSLRQKKVNLIAPDPIPVDSLAEILQSVLINEGLVVTEADARGFRRITTNEQIPRVARPLANGEIIGDVEAAVPIIRIFVLKQAEPKSVAELLKPFLSPVGASAVALDRSDVLIVTDIARNIRRSEGLIEIIDGEQVQVDVAFVAAKNVDVETLAQRLVEILDAKRQALGLTEEESGGLQVSTNPRTNSLILVGTPSDIEQAKQLLEKLDEPLETQQRAFNLRFFSPERFDELIQELIAGRSIKPPYTARAEGSRLIVDSTPELLELIDRTRIQIDTREAPEVQSPVRFYKVRNVPAQELLETLRGVGANISSSPRRQTLPRRDRVRNDILLHGPNYSPLNGSGERLPIQIPPLTPAFRADQDRVNVNIDPIINADSNAIVPDAIEQAALSTETPTEDPDLDSNPVGQASVTADVHTNTIIVVAPPETQRIYASLIERLDQRRPQVLIEAKVVVIDTSDNYTLGVELSGGDRTGAQRLISFSSFGLSTVDAATGALSAIPGMGFNGTLVDPDTADVVVRALTNHRRARVLSTPRILVNDNAEGQLTSVLEVPFTSVNASQTVATTSFAGFAEAGTTINVTPTISDDNYLQMDYVVTLNSFTGTGSEGVPPPRQTNEVRSRVTVPDGYTVIVGGLTSKNLAYEIDSIPILENIPILRELSSLQSDSAQETSLFVFLKPIILREDCFRDLRYLSDVKLRQADCPVNFPDAAPLMIR